MPGLSQPLVTQHLAIKPGYRPVRQAKRKCTLELERQIYAEVQKLRNAKLKKPILHPEWLANVFPVKGKNGQIRVCVDFRDLNKACPKDEFPLPNMDMLIDNTAGYQMFSFMDGYSG